MDRQALLPVASTSRLDTQEQPIVTMRPQGKAVDDEVRPRRLHQWWTPCTWEITRKLRKFYMIADV